ncbi:MAG: peptidylprolyl isomerase [Planctomycetota bacterium]
MYRLLTLIVALTIVAGVHAQDPTSTSADPQTKTAPEQAQPAEQALTEKAQAPSNPMHPRVKLETTLGDIILELDADAAPITVDNFMDYVDSQFYDKSIFHRVIKDFMIQGGQFNADMVIRRNGMRMPIKNEWENGYQHERGTIAMARMGNQIDSATAQFFINVVDNTTGTRFDLDTPRDGAGYAIFGKVVEGMDVVDKIRDTPVQEHPKYRAGGPVVPAEPVVIKTARLIGEYDAKKVKQIVAGLASAEEKAAAAEREKTLSAYITKTEAETGKKFEKTHSGLMYLVLTEGTGANPKPTDLVEVRYEGWLLDGTKFDSSIDRGGSSSFRLDGVIKGWTEGVGLMKLGGKRKLLIPPDLAYGNRNHPKIPANSWLIFEVELVAINPPPRQPAAPANRPPPTTKP